MDKDFWAFLLDLQGELDSGWLLDVVPKDRFGIRELTGWVLDSITHRLDEDELELDPVLRTTRELLAQLARSDKLSLGEESLLIWLKRVIDVAEEFALSDEADLRYGWGTPYVPPHIPLRIYELLPEFYQVIDAELGYPLKKFLEPMQEVLDRIYREEKILQRIQDPDWTPERFLPLIAESFRWTFINDDPESRRIEAKEIVNFYDLKGTPYAIRLLANMIFTIPSVSLAEYYPGSPQSISSIRRDWEDAPEALKQLLAGQGEFADLEWAEDKRRKRGKAYGFTLDSSYFVHLEVPSGFPRGELRAQALKYISRYSVFHPAGRFCYLHFYTPVLDGTNQGPGYALIEELVGGWRLDSSLHILDERGLTLDPELSPVHPSTSWYFPVWEDELDKQGRELDGSWLLDGSYAQAHVLVELN